MGIGRIGERFLEKWRLPGLLYPEDLLLCDQSEEDLKRVVVGCFVEVWRRGLKVNEEKRRVMVLGGPCG